MKKTLFLILSPDTVDNAPSLYQNKTEQIGQTGRCIFFIPPKLILAPLQIFLENQKSRTSQWHT